jgi:hypothetical protein
LFAAVLVVRTIKYLRGTESIGLGTTIKYLRRTTSGAADNGLGTTAKFLRGAASIGLGTTSKYLRRTTSGAPRLFTYDAQRIAPLDSA